MKVPPYPPKMLTTKGTGRFSVRMPPQDDKKSTTQRPTRSGKRRPRSVGGASSGFSSCDRPSPAEQRNKLLFFPYTDEDGETRNPPVLAPARLTSGCLCSPSCREGQFFRKLGFIRDSSS